MDAFWGITLSLIVLRRQWNKYRLEARKKASVDEYLEARSVPRNEAELAQINARYRQSKAQTEEEKQREKDIAELKKKGFTDELIAVILPVVNDSK